ncbi:uncharacterized protein GGS25DRAFT_523820 [Hypoxylon fragiforme]|uniref:uncharacterized protein n=1 Tax=Hypoxylon fragiforme TaxID=63214 RepID=UPI0020C63B68|nr:uncharacterized protein GGS25DRAFT_523820 [Hypoxylon fragiforme]KAI2606154.1 hypothetical protein GGS25DRAFT_523820 [Hypoxylon fragiforme]
MSDRADAMSCHHQQKIIWYCCNCNNYCGGISSKLHPKCISCGHDRCNYCDTDYVRESRESREGLDSLYTPLGTPLGASGGTIDHAAPQSECIPVDHNEDKEALRRGDPRLSRTASLSQAEPESRSVPGVPDFPDFPNPTTQVFNDACEDGEHTPRSSHSDGLDDCSQIPILDLEWTDEDREFVKDFGIDFEITGLHIPPIETDDFNGVHSTGLFEPHYPIEFTNHDGTVKPQALTSSVPKDTDILEHNPGAHDPNSFNPFAAQYVGYYESSSKTPQGLIASQSSNAPHQLSIVDPLAVVDQSGLTLPFTTQPPIVIPPFESDDPKQPTKKRKHSHTGQQQEHSSHVGHQQEYSDEDPKPCEDCLLANGINENKPFACLLYKRNPARYIFCMNKTFKNISSLRQHLDKEHKLRQHHCTACWESFEDSASLKEHAMCRPTGGIPVDKLPKITKDRGCGHKKWYRIWTQLFGAMARRPNCPYPHPARDMRYQVLGQLLHHLHTRETQRDFSEIAAVIGQWLASSPKPRSDYLQFITLYLPSTPPHLAQDVDMHVAIS